MPKTHRIWLAVVAFAAFHSFAVTVLIVLEAIVTPVCVVGRRITVVDIGIVGIKPIRRHTLIGLTLPVFGNIFVKIVVTVAMVIPPSSLKHPFGQLYGKMLPVFEATKNYLFFSPFRKIEGLFFKSAIGSVTTNSAYSPSTLFTVMVPPSD
jgi:hypothetical protein